MKLKQFLKPDWRKIVLSLLVFVILTFIPIIPEFSPILGCRVGYECPGNYVYYTNFYGKFITNLGSMIKYGSTCLSCPSWTDLFIFLIVYLLISYIVSCFIIWAYHKDKKKKRIR